MSVYLEDRLLRPSSRVVIACAALLVQMGCSADKVTQPSSLRLSSILIDTTSFAAERGSTFALTATARNDSGRIVSVPFVWTSSDTTVAAFQLNGLLVARDTGITTITASALGVSSAPIGVRVVWLLAAKVASWQYKSPTVPQPGVPLGDSVRVQVTNRAGGPVYGAQVAFSIDSGGGTVSPVTVKSDSNGLAAAKWTLGPTPGVNVLRATVVGANGGAVTWVSGNPILLTVRSYNALSIVQGDQQTGQLLSTLATAPSVKVVDTAGKPLAGVPVSFIPSNNGSVATPLVSTGSDGVATAGKWTLGDVPGVQTLTAKVDISTIALHATATGTPVYYTATMLSTAGYVSCGLNGNGSVSCWGGGGLLGTGDTTTHSSPVAIANGGQFSAIAGSTTHTCGVAAGGPMYCWGLNADTTDTISFAISPRKVPTAVLFSSVAPGFAGDCAIATDSLTYCWGFNGVGQLGDGTTKNRFTAAPVYGGFHFTQVSSGTAASCGLTASGAAFCWGSNQVGQIGDGTTTNRLAPTAVSGSLSFISIGTGDAWSCGLVTSGQPYCWGQLSQTKPPQLTPQSYTSAPTLTSLTVGLAHACGLTADGTAYCWGSNANGQLGDSTTVTRQSPTKVVTTEKFAAIQAGYQQTCALRLSDNAVMCWGLNRFGEIGNSTLGVQLTPRFVVIGVK